MQKGDKVYVNFPTGRGGPYEVADYESHNDLALLFINDTPQWVEKDWLEPVEPELEVGRLYYTWDNNQVSNKNIEKAPLEEAWDHIEPVHRRWNELSDEEQGNWFVAGNGISQYKYAYELITGEEHP